MNYSKPVQAVIYSGLFLLLVFFSSLDLAVTITAAFYFAVNSKNYVKFLAASLILFLVNIIFKNFDISFRFISDLALDSYILLLTSLFIYLKSQKSILLFFQRMGESRLKLISLHTLVIMAASSMFSLLLAPIAGIPFAVISGYISFSYLTKHFEGRYAYFAGLLFLFFCPFFIIAKKDNISENFAIISFYFLIIGTVQESIRLFSERKKEPEDIIKISDKKHMRKETKSFTFSLPKINFGAFKRLRIMKFVIIAGIAAVLSFAVTYFGIAGGKLP